jgi:N-acetylneuraminic acid mutarotase
VVEPRLHPARLTTERDMHWIARRAPRRALAIASVVLAASRGQAQESIAPLPRPTTNAATAAAVINGDWRLFVMLGIDSTLKWSGITRAAYAWSERSKQWRELPPVPGTVGRLAATAQVVRGRVFLFGGYTVDAQGAEASSPAVDIFDPAQNAWRAGAPTPIAVDDAVSGVYRDSLIVLVSGWHNTDNVRAVQLYDVVHDRWSVGTPLPGPGVFGHGGSIVGNTIVFIDGAVRNAMQTPSYLLESQTWVGTIDPSRAESIKWTKGPTHPFAPLYRPAAGTCGRFVIFAGGTDNPYNYNGIGYNGVPSQPLARVLAFDTRSSMWHILGDAPSASMDHRALITQRGVAVIAGGMGSNQRVRASVDRWALTRC